MQTDSEILALFFEVSRFIIVKGQQVLISVKSF